VAVLSANSEQLVRQTEHDGALSAYWSAVRAHPVVVASITVVAVVASLAFLATRSQEYEATADLLVEALPQDDQTFLGLPLLRDTGDPVRTVQTAASLADSRPAAEQAASELGGDWTADRLLEDAIDVNPEGESNVLAITATAGSADEAAAVANKYSRAVLDVRVQNLTNAAKALIAQLQARLDATPPADELTRSTLIGRIDQIQSLLQNGDPTLVLSQAAVPPTSAAGASPALILALALIAGFTLGSGTAVVLELLTRSVRDEEEAMGIFPMPILLRVPLVAERIRRAPPDANWYMPPQIREPFRTLVVQLEQRERQSGVIMVTSPTTGDGKTSSAINLAVSLAANGKRVILLDFDLRNPQVRPSMRLQQAFHLNELADTRREIGDLLVRPSEFWRLSVLPVAVAGADSPMNEEASWRLPELISQSRALADYVVVDTPPLGEVSDALSLAPTVDDILVVIRPQSTSRTQLRTVRELLERNDYLPTGAVVIEAVSGPSRRYRGYGYGVGGAAELILGGTVTGGEWPARAVERSTRE
jgi:Mrp family chromosome partitioning ATPase/capsular polysaccharide biosynthesis protein